MDSGAAVPETRVVLITAPDREVAGRLARSFVAERLAACVNLVEGVTSVYRWEGQVEEASEVLLVVKTVAARLTALESRLLELHPYDVPEFVSLAPESVQPSYAHWLAGACIPEASGSSAFPEGSDPGQPDGAPDRDS